MAMKVPAVGLSDLVDRANIGMIQRRGGAGLALEALQRRRVFLQLSGQELQSHVPAEAEIFGLIHHAHAAAAELVQDAVVGDGFARHQPGSSKRIFRW